MIYTIDLVVQAFKIIFNSQNLIDSADLNNYIKILDQLFVQQIDFADSILSKIAYNLILCFVNFWQKKLNSSEDVHDNESIKKLNNFFFKDNNYIECLWKSIDNYLDSVNDRTDLEFDKDEYLINRNIEQFIHQLMQPLKFCFLYLQLQTNTEKVKYFIPIINNLLKIINKINITKRDSIQKIRHILLNTLVFTKSLQEKISPNTTTPSTNSQDNSLALNKGNSSSKKSFYSKLSEEGNECEKSEEIYEISEESSLQYLQKNEKYKNILSCFNENILNYQKTYIKILGEFLLIPRKNQLTKNEINIFKNLTELMIRLQEYSQNKEILEWVKYLEKIIFNDNGNVKLSLEAANSILDLILSSLNNQEKYKKIKHIFLEEEIDSSIVNPNYLNELIQLTGVNKTFRELLIGKLYLSLNEDLSNQKMIIDLFIKISKLDENKLINLIENTFKLETSIEKSVKLFSDFWQLLSEYYNDATFFKNNGCIFKMIDYLDSDNPVLRHLSKSWLNQSNKQFQKIIDPILMALLDESIVIVENVESDSIFYFEKEYNTKIISDSFRKLKNIILNSSIINYFIEIYSRK